MKSAKKISYVVVLSLSTILAACGGGTSSSTTDAATATPTPTPTPTPTSTPTPTPTPASSAGSIGKTLWTNNCVSCHGSDTGKGTNASKTLNAIAANTGGMGFLSGTIGATQASQIATYAANPSAY